MEVLLNALKKIIPKRLLESLRPIYHYKLAMLAAIAYRFPSRKIFVVGVTGTKGKSSTVEILNAILEAAGKKTAVAGTIRFKIGKESRPNLYKMTVPGRFFVQRFLRQAVNAKCDYAILEMTSEATKQFRHRFISFDALLYLNLAPEHIESHGSYEKYLNAKLSLTRALETSPKRRKILVVNGDDKEHRKFLAAAPSAEHHSFSMKEAEPYTLNDQGVRFTWNGESFGSKLQGVFNIMNILAAATFAKTQGINGKTIQSALERLSEIPGRVQKISAGQNFEVIVDYAHTPDSLEKLYQAFPSQNKICILGNTGGGRDTWKRPAMAKIAESYCNHIILTNEDPYDEDPRAIVDAMAKVIKAKPLEIIMDRREAIRRAVELARTLRQAQGNDDLAVIITGKGTDPYIMGPNNTKVSWSDAEVAREELHNIGFGEEK
ncbi:MAG: UDP-N-acetylmuramyl-tripeptide synthetase [bacterium]|nr:UDP-N-acetylmuramyl-tripeptide synthetase [bacterium]